VLPVKEYTIIERYRLDSSTAYECNDEELQVLIGEFGEMEPIIDAMNVRSGASLEQRARDIGCSPQDFPEYWDVDADSPIELVDEVNWDSSVQ